MRTHRNVRREENGLVLYTHLTGLNLFGHCYQETIEMWSFSELMQDALS